MSSSLKRARASLAAGLVLAASLSSAAGAQDLSRGEYLSRIMDCRGCHTPGALIGKPDHSRDLAGSDVGFQLPGLGYFYPPNLTPDHETGLGTWSEGDIVRAVRTGVRPDGRELAPVMPWRSYSALSDADAQALARYLKSLRPVQHAAPRPHGPGETPPGPYLTVVMPNR